MQLKILFKEGINVSFSISQNFNLHPVLAKLEADVINENDGTITSSDEFKPIAREQISKADVQLFVKNIFLNPKFFETRFLISSIFFPGP